MMERRAGNKIARGKMHVPRIENASSGRVTFAKRRKGLFKKAHDLSVLCDAEVGVIIFSSTGKLHDFCSSSMQSVLERYAMSTGDYMEVESGKNQHADEEVQGQAAESCNCFDNHSPTSYLQTMDGGPMDVGNIDTLSLTEFIKLEQCLQQSLGHLRRRKGELMLETIQQVTEKRRSMEASNLVLQLQIDALLPHSSSLTHESSDTSVRGVRGDDGPLYLVNSTEQNVE